MSHPVELVVGGILAVWLLLTALNQFQWGRQLAEPLLRYDVCAVVPNWTFFAPNPISTDTHLLHRDIYADGRPGPWRTIELRHRSGPLGSSGGERRVAKGILDLQHTLLVPNTEGDRGGASPPEPEDRAGDLKPASPSILFSTAYLACLNVAYQAPHDQFAAGAQFALATAAGPEDEQRASVQFVSARHVLPMTHYR